MTTPKLSLTGNQPDEVTALAADTLVVGTIQGPDGPTLAPGAEAVDAAFDGRPARPAGHPRCGAAGRTRS